MIFILGLLGLSAFGFKVENKEKVENATTSLQIIVIDAETEEPVPAALVKIDDIELKAYTDFDGLVSFESIQKGNYNLEITLVSYTTTRLKNLTLDQNNNQIVVKLFQ